MDKHITLNSVRKMFKAAGLKNISVSGDKDGTLMFDDCVSMRPEIFTRKQETLRGSKNKKVPGWVVEIIKDIPATREDPPDVDIIEVGEYTRDLDAIKKCLMILKEIEVDNNIEFMAQYDPVQEEYYKLLKSYTSKQQDLYDSLLYKYCDEFTDRHSLDTHAARAILRLSMELVPLHINDKDSTKRCTAIWRLKVGK